MKKNSRSQNIRFKVCKKLLLIVLLPVFSVFAQEAPEKQGVELPEFVITGQEQISFPIIKKIKPSHVTSLSDEFIKPVYSSDELNLREISESKKTATGIFDSTRNYLSALDAALGNNLIPRINGYFSIPMENSFFLFETDAQNQKAYIDNSDMYKFGGKLKFNYLFSEDGGFLPNHSFNASASYNFSAYKFYGAINPAFERKPLFAAFDFGLNQSIDRNINYSLKFQDNFISLSDEKFKENNLGIIGSGFWTIPVMEVRGGVKFFTNNLEINDTADVSNYLELRGAGFLTLFNNIKAGGGVNFSKYEDNSFLHPYLYASLQLNKNFSLRGEFNPEIELVTVQNQLFINRFINLQKSKSLITNKYISISTSAKYEFLKYFEVIGGLDYFKADNYLYFSDILAKGEYEVFQANVDSYSGYLSILVHPGEYGKFFGEIKYRDISDSDNMILPYNSKIYSKLIYGINLNRELYSELKFEYSSSYFSDIGNLNSLNSIFNISVTSQYSLSRNFLVYLELNNLLNKKYSYWNNYEEKPLDFLGGIRIKF